MIQVCSTLQLRPVPGTPTVVRGPPLRATGMLNEAPRPHTAIELSQPWARLHRLLNQRSCTGPMERMFLQTPAMASKALLVVAALTALAWPAGVAGQGVTAMVLSFGDGDTIRVRQAGKALTVRLACIDAPETAQGTYGQQARSYLQQRLLVGREIRLEVKTTDRCGRTVAEVISEINIKLAMVEGGQAFAYRQYLSGCNAQEYLNV